MYYYKYHQFPPPPPISNKTAFMLNEINGIDTPPDVAMDSVHNNIVLVEDFPLIMLHKHFLWCKNPLICKQFCETKAFFKAGHRIE